MTLRRLRPRLPWLLARSAPLVALLVATPSAFAQTIEIASPRALERLDVRGVPVQKRPEGHTPEGISQEDCIEDQRIRISVDVRGFDVPPKLEAWVARAGVDCAADSARNGGAQACWLVGTASEARASSIFDVPVRALMSGVASRTKAQSAETVCGAIDYTTFTLHVFAFDEGAPDAPVARDAVSIEVDTVPPPPPSGLRVTPANGRLTVAWDAIEAAGGIVGARAYCEPSIRIPPSREPPDGGTTRACRKVRLDPWTIDDAGGDAGARSPVDAAVGESDAPDDLSLQDCEDVPNGPGPEIPEKACGATTLVGDSGPGSIPSPSLDERALCGLHFGDDVTSVVVGDSDGEVLENGTSYAIGVALTDRFDNSGPLSPLVCEKPERTNDFWENYKDGGGGAGGGFCSARAPGLPLGSASFVSSVALIAVALRRVRRSPR